MGTPLAYMGINMQVKCDRLEILTALKASRERHVALVAEANAGYIAEAKRRLGYLLAQLQEGKVVRVAGIPLPKPQDFTHVYDTAIAMLQSHQGDSLQLAADEYNHLLRDQWGWRDDFVKNNSNYSASTRMLLAEQSDD